VTDPEAETTPDTPGNAGSELHAFLLQLGRALCLVGAPVNETAERLNAAARGAGAKDTHLVVLPTAILISLGRGGWTTMEGIPQVAGIMRLDQIAAVYELADAAGRGEVTPADGLARMTEIREMQPRFGGLAKIVAYTVMTVGLCLILQPTPRDLLVAGILGAIVGSILRFTDERPAFTVPVPVLCAIVVSGLTFVAVDHGFADPSLRTLIAPLIILLPGSILTTATLELAAGEMVAGASRLVYGAVQMLLLAFGIVVGAELAGVTRAALHDSPGATLGAWAPWLGVVVFGLGIAVYCSAPRSSLPTLLVVLLSAWVGQLLGAWFFANEVSGFFGAFLMTPLAYVAAKVPGAPPAQVTFLPAFWLLVPGAIGLIGVTEVVSDPASAGLSNLATPIASIVSIALGVLCGSSLYRGVAAIPQELQLRRTPQP
jgi:uncharacterized membrane protein YjjP (DUF1212 family)